MKLPTVEPLEEIYSPLSFQPVTTSDAGMEELIVGNSGLRIVTAPTGINYMHYTPEGHASPVKTKSIQYATTFCGAMATVVDLFISNEVPFQLIRFPIVSGSTNESFYSYMRRVLGKESFYGCEDGLFYSFHIKLGILCKDSELVDYLRQMKLVAINQGYQVKNP